MYKLRKIGTALAVLGVLSYANHSYAAPQDDIMQRQQQVLQQQQQDFASKRAQAEMQQRVSQSMAKTQQQGARLEVFSLPEEEKAFEISNFYLKADKYAGKFEWIDKYLDNYNGQKIGVKGINMLMQAINGEIMNRGYVTTRVYVEEQDLSTGNFFFTLLPGTISDIRFREETWGTWHNAVAMKRGSLLNIRDIEQTVDNFNSVPGQNADIKIEPGPQEGQSDLVIDIKRDKPYKLFLSVDNSGTEDTGKAQMSGGLQLSNPLSVNDIFYINWNEDATQSGETKGTRANSIYYSVPVGKERFTFSHSKQEYKQTVE